MLELPFYLNASTNIFITFLIQITHYQRRINREEDNKDLGKQSTKANDQGIYHTNLWRFK